MGKLGKFQSLEFDSWGKTSKLNHLGGIFVRKPQEATNLMVQLLAFHKARLWTLSSHSSPPRSLRVTRSTHGQLSALWLRTFLW